ncbi:MAG TPA: hypothetical protein VKY59_12890 [Spirillospora sp.]|nr:hypothetical protein [Spirillospora sp.]
MLIGTLHPIPPYNFELSINLSRFHSVLDTPRDGAYWRALELDGVVALVRVENRGTTEAPELDVYRMAATGPVDDSRLLKRVAHLLGVDSDMKPFYAAAQRDPVLWPLVEPLYGLKHVRAASLFEALMTTIIEQQIALYMAQRGERWLIDQAGGRIDYGGETFFTFPQPEAIAAMSVEDLLPLKITRIRMNVMLAIARHITAGQLDLNALHTQPAAEALRALTQLKGVGLWTAAWTVIRAFGEYPYIGENDVALQAAINYFYYGQNGRVSEKVVQTTMSRYDGFSGAAAFHILMQWALLRYGAT